MFDAANVARRDLTGDREGHITHMSSTTSHLDQVNEFVARALEEIRSGERDSAVHRLRESMIAQVALWLRTTGPGELWVLRAVRVLSDLCDRSGDYERAEDCIGRLGTTKTIENRILQAGRAWTETIGEQHWCLLQAATSLHRHNDTDEAEAATQRALERLIQHSEPEACELRIRANYMLGRFFQITGRAQQSESYFEAALPEQAVIL